MRTYDEPILALSMAVNKCKPIELFEKDSERLFVFYPTVKKIKMNILKGELSYRKQTGNEVENVLLLHWQNVNTEKPIYRMQIDDLEGKGELWKIILGVKYYIEYYLVKCFMLMKRRIRKRLKCGTI